MIKKIGQIGFLIFLTSVSQLLCTIPAAAQENELSDQLRVYTMFMDSLNHLDSIKHHVIDSNYHFMGYKLGEKLSRYDVSGLEYHGWDGFYKVTINPDDMEMYFGDAIEGCEIKFNKKKILSEIKLVYKTLELSPKRKEYISKVLQDMYKRAKSILGKEPEKVKSKDADLYRWKGTKVSIDLKYNEVVLFEDDPRLRTKVVKRELLLRLL